MRTITLAALTFTAAFSALAQTPVQPYPFAPPPGPQTYPHPLADTDAGFQPIFDGTLKNWDGDPQYWRVEDKILVGEVTPDNLLKQQQLPHLARRHAQRLRTEGRIPHLRAATPASTTAASRYPAPSGSSAATRPTSTAPTNTPARTTRRTAAPSSPCAARSPTSTHPAPTVIANLGTADELKAFIHPNDWNQYHLIVRGNLLIHILNGHIMSEVIDDDTPNRKFEGLIGVQVHVGPPMKIEYRSLLIKPLP